MTDSENIKLFVMSGCQVCPSMEHLFKLMLDNGEITHLEIIDVGQHPDLAEQYQVRSVPLYLINGVAFYGLKTAHEVRQLLRADSTARWREFLLEKLTEGELASAEKAILEKVAARDAIWPLLSDRETSLVVRIGLSAIIETLAETSALRDYQEQILALCDHTDDNIAIDAIYYLSLLKTEQSVRRLNQIAEQGRDPLREQAIDILQDMDTDQLSTRETDKS